MSFNYLVKLVEKIDASAAVALVELSRTLEEFEQLSTLDQCFYWVNSPQGWQYWKSVDTKLSNFSDYRDYLGYLRLISRVEKVDIGAAIYLREFLDSPQGDTFSCSDRLDTSFFWDETPQGATYWGYIMDKLVAYTKNERYNVSSINR
jgi:hypothetical protein